MMHFSQDAHEARMDHIEMALQRENVWAAVELAKSWLDDYNKKIMDLNYWNGESQSLNGQLELRIEALESALAAIATGSKLPPEEIAAKALGDQYATEKG